MRQTGDGCANAVGAGGLAMLPAEPGGVKLYELGSADEVY
jgi:hypothetical protein